MADGLHHRWQAFTRCVRHHRVDGRMRLKMPNAAANGKRSAGGAVTKLPMSERKKKDLRQEEEEAEAIGKQKLVGGRNPRCAIKDFFRYIPDREAPNAVFLNYLNHRSVD